ncbi:related to phosphoesterases [Cephalotrichum gorgonifer]|uniref:Related to phosphoesterases n=1 Tax=Cephalotrichum gorgonifer TaxID=2041049 RepID=A0AAE8MRN2_9PEZI|nr:related to phosphoesterases [Cephalotrichum gorgonifer]
MEGPTAAAGGGESKGPPRTHRTRFVCISDTHNYNVSLPKGDVLIHAGDLTNRGSYSELSKVVAWLEKADFECKIVVAGNHDISLDDDFPYNNHNHDPESSIPLLTTSKTITYLSHSSATITLTSPSGPRTTFRVFGSPGSPRRSIFPSEFSAFQYIVPPEIPRADTPDVFPQPWDEVPLDTDVLITHTPARSHLDRNDDGVHLGCEALLRTMRNVRPRLAVCGHVHPARGAEHVSWGPPGGQDEVEEWTDPAPEGKKICLVDLKGRAGGRAETCVVNCAIMTGRFPHRGHRRLNKPIIVDVELPVRE